MITPRLLLAPVVAGDLDELFALHADPRAFTEDLTEPLTRREQMQWVLARWTEHWAQHGTGYLTVRARDPATRTADDAVPRAEVAELPSGLLGVVGLTPLDVDGGSVLSAYWRLLPDVRGQGVAGEAMQAVLEHPRFGPAGREVIAVTAAGNLPSRALAVRLGFVLAPDRAAPGGRGQDVVLVRAAPPG